MRGFSQVRAASLAVLFIVNAGALSAQAVQAAAGMVESSGVSTTDVRRYIERVRDAAQSASAAAPNENLKAILNSVVSSAKTAVDAHGTNAFSGAYGAFRKSVDAACTATLNTQLGAFQSTARCGPAREAGGFQESSAQVPGVFKAFPEVVFTVGYEQTVGTPSSGGTSIGTNMLGAAVGAAFDVIGSDPLKTYFTNNLSAGLTIPTGEDTRISGALGVGLGGIKLGRIQFWPTVGFEQIDTADVRVPVALLAAAPAQAHWTQPTLTLAVAIPYFLERIAGGQLGPILTAGVRLPHYFAGDTFKAVGALFSSGRSDFRRAGSAQLTFGIAIPLFPIKPFGGGGSDSDTDSSP